MCLLLLTANSLDTDFPRCSFLFRAVKDRVTGRAELFIKNLFSSARSSHTEWPGSFSGDSGNPEGFSSTWAGFSTSASLPF